MLTIKDPRQSVLFDPFADTLDPRAYGRLLEGWQGVFRHVILEELEGVVNRVARHKDPRNGAPTKELYSILGLIFCKGLMNWTTRQAAEAFMYDTGLQYALNLTPCGQYLSERTLERYEKLVVEDETTGALFMAVTSRLVKELELNVKRQRLDSTHVFSDMATFGRTRLMSVTIKRFLRQVKRHAPGSWEALPEGLRERYGKSELALFGDGEKTPEGRRRLREEVAKDLLFLIERFAEDAAMRQRRTYGDLERVFADQCEIVGDKTPVESGGPAERTVEVKENPGGDTIQNPSDPDATYDGHKGPGYQVQVAETCHEENEVQLITAALPQTAVESDGPSLPAVLDALAEGDCTPEALLADGAYGSDENDARCRAQGIELISPASTGVARDAAAKADRLADFAIDAQTGEVRQCPAGHAPESSRYDAEADKTHVSMDAATCAACPLLATCPVEPHRKRYVAHFTSKRLRLARRRRHEQTDEFRRQYAARAGLEGTNSGLKRRLGLGRLRVRGRPRVFHAIWLKCAGWNVLRAAATETLRARVLAIAKKRGFCPLSRPLHGLFSLVGARLDSFSAGLAPPATAARRFALPAAA